jgi:uncharacterized MAPEG superfamily protein
MKPELASLVYSTLLFFVMLMAGSTLRSRAYTPGGWQKAVGNRDDLDPQSPLSRRADRAALNMQENLLVFAVLVLSTHAAGISDAKTVLGAQVFFFARLAYWPVYLAGVKYVRTVVWCIGVAGMAIIALRLLSG